MAIDSSLTSVFIQEGVLTAKELDAALAIRTDVGENIGAFLARTGMITERDRVRCVGIQNGVQYAGIVCKTIFLTPLTRSTTGSMIPISKLARYTGHKACGQPADSSSVGLPD